MVNSVQKKAINNILFHCGNLSAKDKTLVLCDAGTRELADAFALVANEKDHHLTIMEIPELTNHGAEPPNDAAKVMQSSTLILSLCQYSLAHSTARINAGHAGARFLSLPLYDWKLLEDPSLMIDFKAQAPIVKKFADAFTKGDVVHITTNAGTDIKLGIRGRIGNYCPGFVLQAGDLGSPPDIEANISPLEDSAEGTVVIDGSITHPLFGLLDSPVEISVSKGKIIEFRSSHKKYVTMLNELFGPQDSRRRVLAECGVGLNPEAKLTGTMLTDEGALGCLHFGFGANHTVGGLNKVDFHLDFVFHDATMLVDAKKLIESGVPQI